MAERKNSEKRIASNNKWTNAHYDRVNLAIPKGRKDIIKAHADSRDESINSFIGRAISETMERDTQSTQQEAPGGRGTKWGGLCEPSGKDTTTFQPLPSGTLEIAFAAAKAAGEKPADFIVRAIKAHADTVGGPQEDGIVSLPSDTLKAAQEAAEAAGESLTQFVTRAIKSRAALDKRKRG